MPTCSIENCIDKHKAKGLCQKHYHKLWKSGKITESMASDYWEESALERFNSQYEIIHGCWVWKSYLSKIGYGRFYFKGKLMLAHRYSYENFVGLIPDNMEVDHKCKNKSCVNPKHLEAVTHKENIRRYFYDIEFNL
jgi:hypothetical protein